MAEKKKIDSKLEASIRKINFILFVMIFFSPILIFLSIFLIIQSILIDDIEFLFKYSKVNLLFLKLNIDIFPIFASLLIFILYSVNLLNLDRLFFHLLKIKGKLSKIDNDLLVKKFYKYFYETDVYKLFIFATFVLIPLITLAIIMYKFLALQDFKVVITTSFILALASLFALVFLIRRYEEFDFHQLADHIIGLIFIMFLTIVFIYLYFIFLSFVNVSSQNLLRWFTLIIVPLPMIIYLFLAAKVFPKNKKALDVTQLFIPIIFIIMAIVVFVVNIVFVFMKDIPKKYTYAYSLIPKIEVKGKDFLKLYLLGFDYYLEANKPSEHDLLNIFLTTYKTILEDNELYIDYETYLERVYNITIQKIRDPKLNEDIPKNEHPFIDEYIASNLIKVIYKSFENLENQFAEELTKNIIESKRKALLKQKIKKNIEIYILSHLGEIFAETEYISDIYKDYFSDKNIDLYSWLLPSFKPVYYRLYNFKKSLEKIIEEKDWKYILSEGMEKSLVQYISGKDLPDDLKEFYSRAFSEEKHFKFPIFKLKKEKKKEDTLFGEVINRQFLVLNFVPKHIKREYIFLVMLKSLMEEKNIMGLIDINKLMEKNLNSFGEAEDIKSGIDINTKFELAKLRIILDTLDFSYRKLRYAHLLNIYGELANFEGADLKGSNIPLSLLNYVNFTNAKLNYAKLNYSWFFYSIFSNADLSNATLKGSYISNSLFIHTKLKNTDLRESYIDSSLFVKVDLKNADLKKSYIMRSIFINPDLTNVDIKDAKHLKTSLILVANPVKVKRKIKNYQEESIEFNNLVGWYRDYGKEMIFKTKRGKIVGIKNKIFLLYFIYTLTYIKNNPLLANEKYGVDNNETLGKEAKSLLKEIKEAILKLDIPREEKSGLFAIEEGILPIDLIDKETYRAILILLTIIIASASICYYCKEKK